jgi:hypothetical protein
MFMELSMTATSGFSGSAARKGHGPTTVEPFEKEIERGLRALIDLGRVFEIRVPKTRKKTVSGYFDDISAAVRAAAAWDGQAQGVYCTLNWINLALFARSANPLREHAETTTGDDDNERRIWLYIDVDPKGQQVFPPLMRSMRGALTRAREITEYLSGLGWPAPLFVDSGNGVHVYYRIDLPNDIESSALVDRVLKALVSKFDDDKLKVDTTGKNAAVTPASRLPSGITRRGCVIGRCNLNRMCGGLGPTQARRKVRIRYTQLILVLTS